MVYIKRGRKNRESHFLIGLYLSLGKPLFKIFNSFIKNPTTPNILDRVKKNDIKIRKRRQLTINCNIKSYLSRKRLWKFPQQAVGLRPKKGEAVTPFNLGLLRIFRKSGPFKSG